MNIKIFFVFLTFSNDCIYNKFFINLISKYKYFDFIIINNSKEDYLNCGIRINDLYEFTGYQKGLEIIRTKIKYTEKIQIIFINDTIFRSHLKILVSYLIKKIIKYNKSNKSCIIGMKQKTPILMKDIVLSDYFLPTYLFSLILERKDIDKLYLFNPNYVDINILYKDSDFNNKNFLTHINNWLLPKSLIGGWYQSSATSRLSDAHFLRKKVTIFLEAKLQNFLDSQHIHIVYIPDDSNYFKFLMFLDRLYTILLKLQLRTKNYLMRVICG